MSPWVFLAIAVLGGAGAVLRFLLDAGLTSRMQGPFPGGTLAVNLSGSLALGVLVGAGVTGGGLEMLGLGLLGGFTTFSTLVYESHRLAEAGLVRAGGLNLLLSLALGLGSVWLGLELGGLL